MRALAVLFGFVLSTSALAGETRQGAPRGWVLAGPGDTWQDYQLSVEKVSGKSVVTLRSKVEAPRKNGSLLQVILADRWRGKRVRFSGSLRTTGVERMAGLWMRIDGVEFEKAIAYDGMQGRGLHGDTAWKNVAVVLDVPQEAQKIYFGAWLEGVGAVGVQDLKWEVVDDKVPVTDQMLHPSTEPQNLQLDK